MLGPHWPPPLWPLKCWTSAAIIWKYHKQGGTVATGLLSNEVADFFFLQVTTLVSSTSHSWSKCNIGASIDSKFRILLSSTLNIWSHSVVLRGTAPHTNSVTISAFSQKMQHTGDKYIFLIGNILRNQTTTLEFH